MAGTGKMHPLCCKIDAIKELGFSQPENMLKILLENQVDRKKRQKQNKTGTLSSKNNAS